MKNGGEYSGDLSKDVTHLIAYKPVGSKYKAAKTWGIRVVSIEWLQQSLERGMMLDENLYDPLLPAEDRGRDAWVRKQVSTSPSIKRPREDSIAQTTSRKLRRTASAKFESQNDGMWTDIVTGGVETVAQIQKEWDSTGDVHTVTNVENSFKTTPNQSNLENGTISHGEKPKSSDGNQVALVTSIDPFFKGKRFVLHNFGAREVRSLL